MKIAKLGGFVLDGEYMPVRMPELFLNSDVLASMALILILFAVRLIAGRALHHRDNLSEQVARRWTANIRNLLILIALIGLTMIWAPQLRTFAFSLTAVAVAIVVATKELILCLSGSALRTFSRAYAVGDIVEIGTSKGEVVDLNLLSTRLFEFEEQEGSVLRTGRSITLPHSLLFSTPAKVLPLTDSHAPHRFRMTFEPDVNLFALQPEIKRVAKDAIERAIASNAAHGGTVRATRSIGNELPDLEVSIGTTDIGKYRIELRLNGHSRRTSDLESALAAAIGSFVHSRRKVNGQSGGGETEPSRR